MSHLARRSPRVLALPAREFAGARLLYTTAFGLAYFGRLADLSEGRTRDVAALAAEVRAQV